MGGGTGIGGGAHLCGKVKLLDRKLKRADKKMASRNRKNKPYPPKSHQEIHRIPLCACVTAAQ